MRKQFIHAVAATGLLFSISSCEKQESIAPDAGASVGFADAAVAPTATNQVDLFLGGSAGYFYNGAVTKKQDIAGADFGGNVFVAVTAVGGDAFRSVRAIGVKSPGENTALNAQVSGAEKLVLMPGANFSGKAFFRALLSLKAGASGGTVLVTPSKGGTDLTPTTVVLAGSYADAEVKLEGVLFDKLTLQATQGAFSVSTPGSNNSGVFNQFY